VSQACWICGGATRPAERLSPLPFVACEACGFVFRPGVGTDDLRDVYEGGDYEQRDFAAGYADEAGEAERARNARTRLDWVAGLLPRGARVLDVGAAAGAFVAEAGRAGLDASGIEPAPAFAAYARERLGVDVRHGRVEDFELEPGGYDAITLWHVLEHSPDPVPVLARLRAALKPRGLLIVEVPNLDSLAARQLGTAWTHLDPTVHVSQFTPATLRAALDRAGLRATSLHTVAHGTYLTPRERLAPGHVAHWAKLARGGAPRLRHPDRHEFLRAAAQPA